MSKIILASNLLEPFKKICHKNKVELDSLEYTYLRFENEIMYFKTIIPIKMIKPCRECKKNFNSLDNFICRINQAGEPLINLCDKCANRACSGYCQYVSTETHLCFSTNSTIIEN